MPSVAPITFSTVTFTVPSFYESESDRLMTFERRLPISLNHVKGEFSIKDVEGEHYYELPSPNSTL